MSRRTQHTELQLATLGLGLSLLLAACGSPTKAPVAHTAPSQTAGPTASAALSAQAVGTSILNQDALLSGQAGKQWFKDNVPMLEVPDGNIQKVYYYRWSVLQRQLKYTRPSTGYIFTEFLNSVGYAGIYGGIAINIWHNNRDGRWMRNRQFLDDDTNHWARGLGQDRQYQYSNDLAAAAYDRYLVTGDRDFTVGLLQPLITHFNGWTPERREGADIRKTGYDAGAGMYYANPDTEATEFSIASLQTRDGYKGGWGYRPSINSFMYGDMRAIANIAGLAGQGNVASDYNNRASTLKANVQNKLWDPNNKFFYQVMRDNAVQEYGQHPNGGGRDASLPILPEGTRADGRELTSYTPWMYNLPDDTADFSQAWRQIVDPQGFGTPTGPATAERRHRLFDNAHNGCCWWNGPSWPFATSQALMGMGNLLNNYKNNNAVNKNDYYSVLKKYTDLQFKDGHPYIAEAADSINGNWIYDGKNHSEHYNHSSYVDLIISGLIGVRPRADNSVDVNPLIPDNWDFFALENVPYHGHLLTVLWDRSGSKYGRGQGLNVFVDGNRRGGRSDLGKLTVDVGSTQVAAYTRYVNLAANPFGDLDQPLNAYPKASASYTSPYDNAARAIDGQTLYDGDNLGPNSRWTNYGSPNNDDWLEVDFGAATTVNQIKLAFYDDTGTGSIRTPASYQVQYLDGGTWRDVGGQQRTPANPASNEVNVINFASVTINRVRAVMTKAGGFASGVTEFEASLGSGSGNGGGKGTSLPLNQWKSFQVKTQNFTNRYLRHYLSQGFTEIVNAGSDATLKADATFRIVPALDGTPCYSFESRNFAGKYLRHQLGRLRIDANDGGDLMHKDATFCAQTGLADGSGVSFASRNFPNSYIRHRNGEVWLDNNDNSPGFKADASWDLANAWAP
ncbi:MGH1-like glycoside hydrolase domain-containing protein [Deinococcus sp.]|uniref:MGH1-like glycoside hydrolase domain-containing protein n=1 Tax=Deinococcus sp. TaxID=47478 RepID=UPI003B5B4586